MSNDRQVTYTLKLQADPGNAAVSSKLQQQLNQQQAHENRFARQSAQDYTAADRAAKQFESTEERLRRKVGPSSSVTNGRRNGSGISPLDSLIDRGYQNQVKNSLDEQTRRFQAFGNALGVISRQTEREVVSRWGNIADALGIAAGGESARRRSGVASGLGGLAMASQMHQYAAGQRERNWALQNKWGGDHWLNTNFSQFGIPSSGGRLWGKLAGEAGQSVMGMMGMGRLPAAAQAAGSVSPTSLARFTGFGSGRVTALASMLGMSGGIGTSGAAALGVGGIGLGGLLGGLSLAQSHNNYDGPGSIPSSAGRLINRFGGMVGSTSAYLQRSFGMLGKNETPGQVGALPGWARAIPGLETMRIAANAGFAGEGADRSQREQAFKYSQIANLQENATRRLGNEALMRQTRMGFDLTPGFNTDLGRNPAGYLADFSRRQGIVGGEGAAAQANYNQFAGGRNDNQLAEAGAAIQRQTQALEQQKSLVEEQGRAWGTIVDQLASIEQSERSFGVGMLGKSQMERDQLLQDARQFAQDPTKLDDRRLSRLHGAAGALGIEGNQGMVNEVNRRTSPLVDELKNLLGGDARKKALDEGLEKLSPELAKALTTGGFSDAAVQKAMTDFAKTINAKLAGIITGMTQALDNAMQVAEATAVSGKRLDHMKFMNGQGPLRAP